MILAPLAAAALLVSVAVAPNAPNPAESPTLSVHQKTAAMQPLMRSATECIARAVSAHPRFGASNADLGDLIVDSMPRCAVQVRAMIEAYDRYFGESLLHGPVSRPAPGRGEQVGQRRRPVTGRIAGQKHALKVAALPAPA
jgi:hypothetical protein